MIARHARHASIDSTLPLLNLLLSPCAMVAALENCSCGLRLEQVTETARCQVAPSAAPQKAAPIARPQPAPCFIDHDSKAVTVENS